MKKLKNEYFEISAESYKTQASQVMEHLERYGSITTLEAFYKYKIVRLGSVIHILRKKRGYLNIITTKEKSKEGKYYAKYILVDKNFKEQLKAS